MVRRSGMRSNSGLLMAWGARICKCKGCLDMQDNYAILCPDMPSMHGASFGLLRSSNFVLKSRHQRQFEHFRISIFTDFFSKCATSQEWFKQWGEPSLRWEIPCRMRGWHGCWSIYLHVVLLCFAYKDVLGAEGLKLGFATLPTEWYDPPTTCSTRQKKSLG